MESSSFLEQAITFIPQEWRYALAANEILPKHARGATLFADISGFTPLSEALVNAYGLRRGAEEIPRTLNQIYTALITEVDRFGGSVIDFAGDSITCWFDNLGFSEDASRRASAAALGMQSAVRAFEAINLPGKAPIVMRVKISIAFGPARRFLVGDPAVQRLAVMGGETLLRMAEGEHLTAPGEVWVDEKTAASLGNQARLGSEKVTGKGDRFFLLEGLNQPVAPCPWPALPPGALSEEQVAPWLQRPVYTWLHDAMGEFLTELRPVAALFMRFRGIDFETDLQAGKKLDDLICRVQKILVTYEGMLVQITIGDKGSYLYLAFGAVVAHEDDARRAVDAAFLLRDLSVSIGWLGEVQIGISQGTMRTGIYGSPNRRAYGVLGDEVNLAARLMSRASPGEILVSNHIYQSVANDRALRSDSVLFEARPPELMKGKAEPVSVFAASGAQRKRAVRLQEPVYPLPMVGRQAELKLIDEKMTLALAGKSQVIGITADAGIGKSRLIAEAIRQASRKGLEIYGGACQSDATTTPYLVWAPIWRAIFEVNPDAPLKRQVRSLEAVVEDYAPDRADSIPLLGSLVGIEIPDNDFTAELEPQYRRMALEALLVDCLKCAAKEAGSKGSGLLLVLEDLHWIDPVSHDLLERAARATVELPVVFLLAYRPPEIQRQPAPRVEKLAQFTKIILCELTDTEAEQAVRAKFAQMYPEWRGAVPKGLIRLVIEQSQGNPFYAEELLNYLNDQNVDFHDLRAVESLELPTSLHSLILSRIDQLTAMQQITLKSASVIGRVFQKRVVNWMIQQEHLDVSLEPSLAELQRRELIRRRETEQIGARQEGQPNQDELEFIFKHIITQEVAYNSLLTTQRRLLHHIAAEAIEALFPEALDELSATLAYHYELGDGTEKAIHYLLRAARRASSIYANGEAISFYQKAIPLVRQRLETDPGGSWRQTAFDLYEALGDILEMTGRHEEAREAYQYAMALSQVDDRIGRSRLYRKIGHSWEVQSQFNQVITAYDQAEAMLGETCDDVAWRREWIDIHNARIYLFYWMARTEDMKALINQLEPFINQYGSQRQKAGFLININALNFRLEHYYFSDATMLLAEETVKVSREAGDMRILVDAVFRQGFAYLWGHRWEKCELALLESLALAEKIGDMVVMLRSLTYLTVLYRWLGDMDKVESYIPRCLEAAERTHMAEYTGTAYANLAWIYWKKGDLEGFEANFKAAYQAWDRVDKAHASRSMQWLALMPSLSVALDRDELNQAVDHARIILDPTYSVRLEADLTQALAQSIEAWEAGRIEETREFLRQSLELASKYGYL
jgi:class 3 adenylate cyclase/tetratricopeptide (TPR) repeat protein